MIFSQWVGKWAMKAFIGAVIILGFFGPYIISFILILLCLVSWLLCRNKNEDANSGLYTKHDTPGPRHIAY